MSSAAYKFAPVPIFTTGMSKNLVFTDLVSSSKILASIAKHLSVPLSLLSSHNIVNGCFLHLFIRVRQRSGAMACFIICVHFVRLQANFSAILLSGNIFLQRLVKWSETVKDKLCSATKLLNKISALVTWSSTDFVGKSWCNCFFLVAVTAFLCKLVSECLLISYSLP